MATGVDKITGHVGREPAKVDTRVLNRFAAAQINRLAAHLVSVRPARGRRLAEWDRLVDSTADALVGTARVRGLRTKFDAKALAPKAAR